MIYDLEKLQDERKRLKADMADLRLTFDGALERMQDRLDLTEKCISDCINILEKHEKAEQNAEAREG